MWNVILQVHKTIVLRPIDPLHVIEWDLTLLSLTWHLLSSGTSQSLNPTFPILLQQVVWLSSDSFSCQAYFTSSLGIKYLTSSNIMKHLPSEYPARNTQATWIKGLNDQEELAESEGPSFKREAKYTTVNSTFTTAVWPDEFASLGNSTGAYLGRGFFPWSLLKFQRAGKRKFGLQDSQAFKIERPRYKTCEPRSQYTVYLQIIPMS